MEKEFMEALCKFIPHKTFEMELKDKFKKLSYWFY